MSKSKLALLSLVILAGAALAFYFLTASHPVERPLATNGGQAVLKSKPGGSQAVTSQPKPASVLDLRRWKLTLPISTIQRGKPDEIYQPNLAGFIRAPYFVVNAASDGVVFRAPVGGVTTKNSNFPRSELREMDATGVQEASWSSTQGTHTMTVREAVTHLPAVRPKVVAAQIHDASRDIILIALDRSLLYVQSKGKNIATLDPNYKLGTPYDLKIDVSQGQIKVYYNGALSLDYAMDGPGLYFKAGCYTQSNLGKGDLPDEYAEVVIYGLNVNHV